MSDRDTHDAVLAAQAATREYELSRERHMRTLFADAEEKVRASVGARRDKLAEELRNLHALASARADARNAAFKAYAAMLPRRMTASGPQPPSATERLANFSADKYYKAAVKAAEEFTEVNDILRKRRESLEQIDGEMKTVLARRREELIQLIESPEGLANAFRRDPLLGQAHARMVSAIAKRDAIIEGTSPVPKRATP